jgi:serine/threonine protein kinase
MSADPPDPGVTRLRGAREAPDGAETKSREQRGTEGLATLSRDARTRLHDAASGAADAADFDAGTLLKGRFELKSLVGRGGMGIVWAAVDRRKLEARDPHPDVAVKILNSSASRHPDAFVALQREASKAQTLAHPNIATVFDFDRDGANVFITMELLRGQPLDKAIGAARGRGIGRAAALPIIRGIAEGLAYAHRKGIVHSDLKPANVFLGPDGTPKILDFGIARAVPSAGGEAPEDAWDAGSLGAYTEAYATDEMVEGRDPAPADDIYALGIIAYELLSGKHPFHGMAMAAARAANMSATPIRSLRRREWRTLARALSFERARRPRDAGEFIRQFFGATRVRNALIGAVVLLACAAALLVYRNYRQAGPAVAFEDLPADVQQKIRSDFAEGDEGWALYTQDTERNADGLASSLSFYAEAYKLHPRDRDAARRLERSADEILKRARADPARLRETAQGMAALSDFLKTYPPVVEAMGQ